MSVKALALLEWSSILAEDPQSFRQVFGGVRGQGFKKGLDMWGSEATKIRLIPVDETSMVGNLPLS
jgi:hypothetical protein